MAARKYKQRGYQDDERPERPTGGVLRRQEGPRGRGLGAPTRSVFKCARCGQETALDATSDACRKCGSDLHSCTNCRHFDSAAHNECRAGVEQRVASKTAANDCTLFEPRVIQDFAADSGADTPSGARAAFDDLFDF